MDSQPQVPMMSLSLDSVESTMPESLLEAIQRTPLISVSPIIPFFDALPVPSLHAHAPSALLNPQQTKELLSKTDLVPTLSQLLSKTDVSHLRLKHPPAPKAPGHVTLQPPVIRMVTSQLPMLTEVPTVCYQPTSPAPHFSTNHSPAIPSRTLTGSRIHKMTSGSSSIETSPLDPQRPVSRLMSAVSPRRTPGSPSTGSPLPRYSMSALSPLRHGHPLQQQQEMQSLIKDNEEVQEAFLGVMENDPHQVSHIAYRDGEISGVDDHPDMAYTVDRSIPPAVAASPPMKSSIKPLPSMPKSISRVERVLTFLEDIREADDENRTDGFFVASPTAQRAQSLPTDMTSLPTNRLLLPSVLQRMVIELNKLKTSDKLKDLFQDKELLNSDHNAVPLIVKEEAEKEEAENHIVSPKELQTTTETHHTPQPVDVQVKQEQQQKKEEEEEREAKEALEMAALSEKDKLLLRLLDILHRHVDESEKEWMEPRMSQLTLERKKTKKAIKQTSPKPSIPQEKTRGRKGKASKRPSKPSRHSDADDSPQEEEEEEEKEEEQEVSLDKDEENKDNEEEKREEEDNDQKENQEATERDRIIHNRKGKKSTDAPSKTSSQDTVPMATPSSPTDLKATMDRLTGTLDACHVILLIWSEKSLAVKSYSEDMLESVLLWMKWLVGHLSRLIADHPSSPQQRMVLKHHIHGAYWLYVAGRLGDLYPLIERILVHEYVHEHVLYPLMTVMISSLACRLSSLTWSAFQVLCTVTGRYDVMRAHVMSEAFSLMMTAPQALYRHTPLTSYVRDGTPLHPITLLLLHLIQTAALTEPSGKEDKGHQKRREKRMQACAKLFLETTVSTATRCVSFVLARCLQRANTNETFQESRMLLECFSDDLMLAVGSYEWPVAEVVLRVLCKVMVDLLLQENKHSETASSSSSSQSTEIENNMKGVLIDILGKITATVQGHERVDGRVLQVATKHTQESAYEDAMMQYLGDQQTRMPEDHDKVRWIKMYYLWEWLNESQQRGRMHTQRRQRAPFYISQLVILQKEATATVEEEEEEEKKQQESSHESSHSNEDTDDAGQTTTTVSKNDAEEGFLFQKNDIPTVTSLPTPLDTASMTVRGLVSMLNRRRSLFQSFDALLKHLLRLSNEPVILFRTKALKCLHRLVMRNAALLSDPLMQQTVQARTLDPSIAVREAAIDLIGRHVLALMNDWSLRDQWEAYLSMLMERLADKGVSVRKKIVHVLRDVCLSVLEKPSVEVSQLILLRVCEKLLHRLSDEEPALRSHACRALRDILFRPVVAEDREGDKEWRMLFPALQTEDELPMPATESAAVTPQRRSLGNTTGDTRPRLKYHDVSVSLKKEIKRRADWFIHLVAGQESLRADWMFIFIDKILSESTVDKESSKTLTAAAAATAAAAVKSTTTGSSLTHAGDEHVRTWCCLFVDQLCEETERSEASLTLLYVLSRIVPEHFIPHVALFQQGLSVRDSVAHTTYSLLILQNILPMIEHPDALFLQQLQKDLVTLVTQQPQAIVLHAVKCLCMLVKGLLRDNNAVLVHLLWHYYALLQKGTTNSNSHTTTEPSTEVPIKTMLRALVICASLVAHYDFDKYYARLQGIPDATLFPPQQVTQSVFQMCILFSQSASTAHVSNYGVMALGTLLPSYPQLALQPDCQSVLTLLTSREATALLVTQATAARALLIEKRLSLMKSFKALLEAEEARMVLSQKQRREKRDVKRSVAKQQQQQRPPPTHSSRKQRTRLLALSTSKEVAENADTGVAGCLIQHALPGILECSFTPYAPQLRKAALDVLSLVLRQGLVHPLTCVPHLMALTTDDHGTVREMALVLVKEMHDKYASFLYSQFAEGIQLAYEFQKKVLFIDAPSGRVSDPTPLTTSLSLFDRLYSLIRRKRHDRYRCLMSVLQLFDRVEDLQRPSTDAEDPSSTLNVAFYRFMAECVTYFPYQVQEEPLFVIHQMNKVLSTRGMTLLATLQSAERTVHPPIIVERARVYGLLVLARMTLQHTYHLNDTKCHQYLPSELAQHAGAQVTFEKPLAVKAATVFLSQHAIPWSLFERRRGHAASALTEEVEEEVCREFQRYMTMEVVTTLNGAINSTGNVTERLLSLLQSRREKRGATEEKRGKTGKNKRAGKSVRRRARQTASEEEEEHSDAMTTATEGEQESSHSSHLEEDEEEEEEEDMMGLDETDGESEMESVKHVKRGRVERGCRRAASRRGRYRESADDEASEEEETENDSDYEEEHRERSARGMRGSVKRRGTEGPSVRRGKETKRKTRRLSPLDLIDE